MIVTACGVLRDLIRDGYPFVICGQWLQAAAKSERYWVIEAQDFISDGVCLGVLSLDEGSISGGGSEPSSS